MEEKLTFSTLLLIAGDYCNYSVIEANEIKGTLRFFLWTAFKEIEKCQAFINVRTQQYSTSRWCLSFRLWSCLLLSQLMAVESGHNVQCIKWMSAWCFGEKWFCTKTRKDGKSFFGTERKVCWKLSILRHSFMLNCFNFSIISLFCVEKCLFCTETTLVCTKISLLCTKTTLTYNKITLFCNETTLFGNETTSVCTKTTLFCTETILFCVDTILCYQNLKYLVFSLFCFNFGFFEGKVGIF